MICCSCDKNAVYLVRETEHYTPRGLNRELIVPNVEYSKCSSCGFEFYTLEQSRVADKQFKNSMKGTK